jgi:hypothetical protein
MCRESDELAEGIHLGLLLPIAAEIRMICIITKTHSEELSKVKSILRN